MSSEAGTRFDAEHHGFGVEEEFVQRLKLYAQYSTGAEGNRDLALRLVTPNPTRRVSLPTGSGTPDRFEIAGP